MKKISRMLRRRRHPILNWLQTRDAISLGGGEGFNGNPKLPTRKAFGLRTPQGTEIALLHVPGRIPEPTFTHEFCRKNPIFMGFLNFSHNLQSFITKCLTLEFNDHIPV